MIGTSLWIYGDPLADGTPIPILLPNYSQTTPIRSHKKPQSAIGSLYMDHWLTLPHMIFRKGTCFQKKSRKVWEFRDVAKLWKRIGGTWPNWASFFGEMRRRKYGDRQHTKYHGLSIHWSNHGTWSSLSVLAASTSQMIPTRQGGFKFCGIESFPRLGHSDVMSISPAADISESRSTLLRFVLYYAVLSESWFRTRRGLPLEGWPKQIHENQDENQDEKEELCYCHHHYECHCHRRCRRRRRHHQQYHSF